MKVRGSDTTPGANKIGDNGKFARPSIWLSLSGGGLRAAIFHYGCLKRLQEVGLLGHVYGISATSGGAIIAALLAMYPDSPHVDGEQNILVEQFKWEEFERAFLAMAVRGLFAPVFVLMLAYSLYGIGLGLLVVSCCTQHYLEWPQFSQVAVSVAIVTLLTGVTVHAILASMLLRGKAHQPSKDARRRAKMNSTFATAEWSKQSWRRLLKMLLVPPYLRWQILNLRLFAGTLLRGMPKHPKIFLTTVELNRGKEIVFTSGAFSTLDEHSSELWDDYVSQDLYRSGDIQVAQAVAASSAFPPFFRAVSIRDADRHIGSFVDGGVLDNYSLNVPKAFSVHIHPDRGQRYDSSITGTPSFRETVSFILVMDGAKAPALQDRLAWGRLRTGKRLLSILTDQQLEAAFLAVLDWRRNVGIKSAIVGLQMGFPDDDPLAKYQIADYISQVRTHLDAFTLEECAAISYSGYLWTEEVIRERPWLLSNYELTRRDVPMRGFSEILPDHCGEWNSSPDAIGRHLFYSRYRLGLVRYLGRMFSRQLSIGAGFG